ncbi:MAG: tRNA(m5U54)methyltransferase [Cyphobasidiales sp. Tagirdzhanova-0007]|nr:MAG: tRNA(m5U54)methyltransferase [Cyphobasidiales sp. Tagirdzhanova-0007]
MPRSTSPPSTSKRTKLTSDATETNATQTTSSNGTTASSSLSFANGSNGLEATMLPVSKKVGQKGKSRKRKIKPVESGGLEDTMFREALYLLGTDMVYTAIEDGRDYYERFGRLEEIELEVIAMSSHGEGLAVPAEKDWIVAVPFCIPGERVLARVHRNDRLHSYADLVEVLRCTEDKENWRDDARIQCKYFGKCSGCQYQMLSYERQLLLKQDVVRKAYANFSGLTPSLVPEVQDTLPSPRQYGYRTKLTPHFDQPTMQTRINDGRDLQIGFQQKGRRAVMDIEDCPIGTQAINAEMKNARAEVRRTLSNFKRGATLLLRDSLRTDIPIDEQIEADTEVDEVHVCIKDHNAAVRERVADKFFTFQANSFFQNNNGILSSLVQCIRDLLPRQEGERCLVDAYCGSGLFSITLAECFKKVAGIEISGKPEFRSSKNRVLMLLESIAESIKYAKLNAQLNGLRNVEFVTGSAEAIFEGLAFPANETTVLIDPPRKGCDERFLRQLLAYTPARIARDVGYLLKESEQGYTLDSIRGCDLFPQTYHVESLAVLSKA